MSEASEARFLTAGGVEGVRECCPGAGDDDAAERISSDARRDSVRGEGVSFPACVEDEADEESP